MNLARIQIGLTDVASSTWWMKIHPATGLRAPGPADSRPKAQVIDAIDGEQVAAWIRTASASQCNLNVTTLADAKNVVDQWAKVIAKRLADLRDSAAAK